MPRTQSRTSTRIPTPPIHTRRVLACGLACAVALLACADDDFPTPRAGLRYPDAQASDARADTKPDAADARDAAAADRANNDGGGGNNDGSGDDAGTVAQMLGPAGGTVSTAAGVSVTVPAGGVAEPTLITVTPTASAPPEAAGPAFLFGPEGQQFAQPVSITLPFDPSALPAGEAPVVYTAPAGSTAFEAIPATLLDPTHVQASTTHFSVFVVGRKKTPPRLALVTVAPSAPEIAHDSSLQFTATAIYTDNSKRDVSATALWTSSAPAIATITAGGLAQGKSPGVTTISAELGGLAGATTLTVRAATLAAVAVTPSNPSIAKGTTVAFMATGVYTDNTTQDVTSQVTWTSSNPAVASVAATGIARALVTGQTTITATSGDGKIGTTVLTVTAAPLLYVAVTPPSPAIAKGTSLAFTATGTYGDQTTQDLTAQVTWTSSNPAVATVSSAAGSEGEASGVAVGWATITASIVGISGSATLSVKAATLDSIAVTPVNPSIAKGTTQQLAATGSYSDGSTQDLTAAATWTSASGSVAEVSNAAGSHGRATAVGVGTTVLRASLGDKSGTTMFTVTAATLVGIAVTPVNPSIAKGTALPLTATGIYSDSTTQDLTAVATWSSSNDAVATVSNAAASKGLATSAGVGTASLSASMGGRSAATTLTVTAATLVSITVSPATPSIANGTQQPLTATGHFTDGSTQDLTAAVTWASSSTSVASVSNAIDDKGTATAVGVGTTVVSAISAGKTGSVTLTVTAATLAAIAVTPATASIALGTGQPFVAIGHYTDASTQDLTALVTFASSNPAVAMISNVAESKGRATSVGLGNTTITAALGGKSGMASLTVTAATLASITVSPATATIAAGASQPFVATGHYSDATTQDLTATALWASDMGVVATVSNDGSRGLATGLATGTATITATVGATVGSAMLTVTPPQ